MPVFDIVPPEYKREEEKEYFLKEKEEEKRGIDKETKESKEKPKKKWNFFKKTPKPILIGGIFFLLLLSFLILTLHFVTAEKEFTKDFYPTRCEGDWQNPGNAASTPDVLPKGNIFDFSERNSAIYTSGPKELMCKWFDEIPPEKPTPSQELCGEQNQNCQISSAKLYLSFAIDEEEKLENQKENEQSSLTNQTNQLATQTTQNENTQSQQASDIDTKIILWYSTDHGKTWNSFAKITSLPLSNYLNNGYLSFDAPFIKKWEDVENLRVMIEGVVGGEQKIVAFLDSMWVEVGVRKGIGDIKNLPQEIKEKIFSMFSEREKRSEKIENIQKEFEYKIPSDGKIIAQVKNSQESITGVFRINIFSEDNELVGIVDIFSADFIKREGYDVPPPQSQEIDHSLFSEVKEESSIAFNVKKDWGKTKFKIDYIPIEQKDAGSLKGNEANFISENLELFFYPEPITIDNLDLLVEDKFNTNEKKEKETRFENQKTGTLIIELEEKESSGGGGILMYLDEKGIALIEGGYNKEGRFEVLRDILPGEHKLIFKNVDSFWDDNKGERLVKIYFKEKK